jgi:pimeloyl-ACP methyl ester carboxylesterase
MYLDVGSEGVFAFFNPTHAGSGETAVVICPPFGWDLMSPYRARRDWAEHLAARGYPTMRIDLQGTGDSAGMPTDPARLDAWTRAVFAAALSLRCASGAQRIVAIGIGLGGVVAYHAAAAGAAVEDLVLWGVPARGRALVRELRALARLSSSSVARSGGGDTAPLPHGAVLAAGYLLSAETTAALEQLDLGELALPDAATRRVLLLGRGQAHVDEPLRRSLQDAGARVTVARGPGLERIGETFACVDRWLDEGHDPPKRMSRRLRVRSRPTDPSAPADPDPSQQHLRLTCEEGDLRESAIWIERPRGRLFGVLAEPVGPPQDLCMVLLNAGPQRHIGPNRMWVEIARRWAVRGVPSLRIDLSGIGDSDGDASVLAIPGALYAPEYLDETIATLAWLHERGLPDRFVLVGLCSGAYWAMHVAVRDHRIGAIVMLNPRRLIWDKRRARAERMRRRLRRLPRASALRRALTGDGARTGYVEPAGEPVEPNEPAAPTSPLSRIAMLRLGRRRKRNAELLNRLFDALRDHDQRALLMLTSWEPLHQQLVSSGAFDGAGRWPNLELVTFETAVETHTLAPLWLQQEIHKLVDRVLEDELERVPERAGLTARASQ